MAWSLVSPDDDPLFSADRVHCPSDIRRRATISVAEVEENNRRAAEADRLRNGGGS